MAFLLRVCDNDEVVGVGISGRSGRIGILAHGPDEKVSWSSGATEYRVLYSSDGKVFWS